MENSVVTLEQITELGGRYTSKNFNVRGTLDSLKSESSNKVYGTLKELTTVIEDLHPNKNKSLLVPSFWKKLMKINTVNQYLEKYETTKDVIDKIVKELDQSKLTLHNDTVTMRKEVEFLNSIIPELESDVEKCLKYKEEIELEIKEAVNDEDKVSLQSNLLFPCQQKLIDLEQKVAVTKQAIVTIGTIVKNNLELAISVDRARDVTLSTLSLAVTITQSLNEQKRVTDLVGTINNKTSDMLVYTSNLLKQQGVEIQKQASSSMLDTEKLSQAFDNVLEAYNEINNFRINSIEKLEKETNRLREVSKKLDKEQLDQLVVS